jgi:hypothetical protein
MKTKALQTLAVMGIASIAIAGSVHAATFTVFGTGDSGTGPVGSPDANFTLVSSVGPITGTGAGTTLVVTNISSGTFHVYQANSPNSATAEWINPTSSVASPTTNYIYQETFTLAPGDILSTAQITGLVKADDSLKFIYLNGVKVFTGSGTNNSWSSNSANSGFTINSGFQIGINTLDFVVPNTSGATALFAQINSATVSVVPEPSTVAVYLLGSLALLGFVVRKKRIS